jgi:DNA-directed RNA polymerase subunit omega
MAERHDSMMNPQIEGLLSKTSSKFRLVTLASQRARQINAYFGHLGEGLGSAVPPQVTSLARKPLSIAFEEIASEKIIGVPISEPFEGVDGEFDGLGHEGHGGEGDPTLATQAAAREAVSQQLDADAAADAEAASLAEDPGDVIVEGATDPGAGPGPGGDEG